MAWYELTLGIAILVFSALLLLVVMLQKSDEDGMNAFTGAVSNPQNRAKARGIEGKLPLLTIILGVSLALLCIGLVILIKVTAA